jgi:hypothetical protein
MKLNTKQFNDGLSKAVNLLGGYGGPGPIGYQDEDSPEFRRMHARWSLGVAAYHTIYCKSSFPSLEKVLSSLPENSVSEEVLGQIVHAIQKDTFDTWVPVCAEILDNLPAINQPTTK